MDDLGFQLAEIAADAWDGADQSARILDLFAPVGCASAAILTRWDPVARRHTVAAVRGGYPADLVTHLVSGDFHRTDPGYRIIRNDPKRPLRCWRDLGEVDYARSPTARRFLLPEGFRGGVGDRVVEGHQCGEQAGEQQQDHAAPVIHDGVARLLRAAWAGEPPAAG